jgi:hypothetical protein
VDQLHGRTAQEIVADFNCLRVAAPTIEERHHLIEYLGGGHQPRDLGHKLLPVLYGGLMMLIVGNFER